MGTRRCLSMRLAETRTDRILFLGLPNSRRLFTPRVDDVTSMNIFEGISATRKTTSTTLRPRSGWSASSASNSTWRSSSSSPTTDGPHRTDLGLDLGEAYLNIIQPC